MPYFKNKDINILLIHIPKTGGTSLEDYFSNKYNIEINEKSLHLCHNKAGPDYKFKEQSLQHLRYKDIINNKDYFKIDENNLKIISVVRNPYTRTVSDLLFTKKINRNSTKEQTYNQLKKYVNENWDNHNIPQYLFLENCNNVKILKTENLTEDMKNLGYTDFNNNTYNQNIKDYFLYLNNDSIELINKVYDMDFKLFGYNKIIPEKQVL